MPPHQQHRAINSAPLARRRSVEESSDEELATLAGHMRVREDTYHHYSEGDIIARGSPLQSTTHSLHNYHTPHDHSSGGGEEGDVIATRLFRPSPHQ
jgi:hypothetical protein